MVGRKKQHVDEPDSALPHAHRGELGSSHGWRGDDHTLCVGAAREVGLPLMTASVESFAHGFKAGLVMEDAADGAVVLRGRTVLDARELGHALLPLLRYIDIPKDAIKLAVHDGGFELRISRRIAETSRSALGAARTTLMFWLVAGLAGASLMRVSQGLTLLVWSGALLVGAWMLRRGSANGRTMLAARLVSAFSVMAHEHKLILPPGDMEAP